MGHSASCCSSRTSPLMGGCQPRVSTANSLLASAASGARHEACGVDSQDLLPEESLSFTGLVTPSATFGLAVETPLLEPVFAPVSVLEWEEGLEKMCKNLDFFVVKLL